MRKPWTPKTKSSLQKENSKIKVQPKNCISFESFHQPIEEWKQCADRIILNDIVNCPQTKKYSLPSRRRFSSPGSLLIVQQDDIIKLSAIEELKRQANFLQQEYIQQQKLQFIKTQPASVVTTVPIKYENNFKTQSNAFFRPQQRYSVLQKRRSRLKRLKKIQIQKTSLKSQSNTKGFKQQESKNIQQVNSLIIVYPLVDTVYQQEIRRRLSTSLSCNKRALRQQRSLNLWKQSQVVNNQNKIRVKIIK